MADNAALQALGYSPHWQALFEPFAGQGLTPARVIRSDRGSALIATPAGMVRGQPSARLTKAARGSADMPATGDWVAVLADDGLDVALIDAVLERTSAITRGDPGKASDVQVLAANMDTVFVVHPIAEPPNLRRIERELSLAWDWEPSRSWCSRRRTSPPTRRRRDRRPSRSRPAWTCSSRTRCPATAPSCSSPTSRVIAQRSWSAPRAPGSPRSSTGFSASSDRRPATCVWATGAGATRRSPASSSRCRTAACSSTLPDCGRSA